MTKFLLRRATVTISHYPMYVPMSGTTATSTLWSVHVAGCGIPYPMKEANPSRTFQPQGIHWMKGSQGRGTSLSLGRCQSVSDFSAFSSPSCGQWCGHRCVRACFLLLPHTIHFRFGRRQTPATFALCLSLHPAFFLIFSRA